MLDKSPDSSSIVDAIGDPVNISRSIDEYREDAEKLSSRHTRLRKKYDGQWIAFYRGRVRAHASTLDSLAEQIQEKRLPRNRVIIRFFGETRKQVL